MVSIHIKGAIFSFGLMISAITYYLSQKKYLVCLTLTQEDWHIISNYIKEMIEEDMQNDFKKIIEKKKKRCRFIKWRKTLY